MNGKRFAVSSVHTWGLTTTVTVAGELDLRTVQRVAAELGRAEVSGSSVVVDLASVTVLDKTGLQALLDAHERARTAKRGFAVLNGAVLARRDLECPGYAQLLDAAIVG